jgi:hypothetical protein
MDRAWTGKFFNLHNPEWQGPAQRSTFLWLFGTFREVARQTAPQGYVTGNGWRTSRSKILDNALIGYCKAQLDQPKGGSAHTGQPGGAANGSVSFWVAGYPPAKGEAKSMLSESHPHAPRVRALLHAAEQALRAADDFIPADSDLVAMDLVLHASPDQDPWDATNYLGGVADVLEDKSRRGAAVTHLGALADVWLYRNDRQIKQITYREQQHTTAGYTVTLRMLPR